MSLYSEGMLEVKNLHEAWLVAKENSKAANKAYMEVVQAEAAAERLFHEASVKFWSLVIPEEAK